jgi:hypothetical protein
MNAAPNDAIRDRNGYGAESKADRSRGDYQGRKNDGWREYATRAPAAATERSKLSIGSFQREAHAHVR